MAPIPNPVNVTESKSKPDKKLFTPGPLCCSSTIKKAMLRDLGSRDIEFIEIVKFIRNKLVEIAGVSSADYTAVPLQGSGTYAVEAVLQTTTPREGGRVLILTNGVYGKRMKKACDMAMISSDMVLFPEDEKMDLELVKKSLRNDIAYTTVAIVHCETSSGAMNPVEEVGQLVKQYQPNACYFIDAMSSFGAIPLDMEAGKVDYLVSSANKCLQGVPGFSYAIAKKAHLINCKGNCRSLSLDLVEQYEGLEANGQFRFTPPTHSILAFRQALLEFEQEGGITGRAQRYKENRSILKEGMKKFGFRELLDDSHAGYIITSFFFPLHPNFIFQEFYRKLSNMDQVIYPGKVTSANCFRIGNIGHLFPEDMRHLLSCIEKVLNEMDIPIPVS